MGSSNELLLWEQEDDGMSKIQKCFLGFLSVVCSLVAVENGAFASKGAPQSYSTASESSRPSGQEMLMDLSVHYVRDTKPEGGTDSAARFSIGGMFNEWVGLDLQGLYEVHSKSYLVGTDFRFVPVEWFFLKGGAGAYADKNTNSMTLTPLAGAGIKARLSREYYFVTEASYFTINDRNNISFGVGLGTHF
ncbi:MAG: hypothetical protein HY074_20215 [Deltaproteobacteria bacterium]|nr:hypothetical protein [Deltaproteobacteria bacterium]